MLTLLVIALILFFVAPRLLGFLLALGVLLFILAAILAFITGGLLFGGLFLLAL